MDSSLDLVPGRLKAAHCSWGVLEEGRSRMGEMQRLHSLRHQACVCVCVCPVSSLYMHVAPALQSLRTAPGGSWSKDVPVWEKCRDYIHCDIRPACVCVCVLCRHYICTCV